jgi:hypothetical protein
VFSRCNVEFGSAYCDIARIDADGSHRRTLVAGHWIHERPRYSPDGRKLAFSSNKGGFQGAVWTANADGGRLRRLTAPALEGFWPDWSPDGSVGLDGGGLRALTQFRPGANEVNDFWPTVAPDGRIAYGRPGAGGSPPRYTSWARPGPAPIRSPRRRSWQFRGNGRPTAASW